MAQGDDYVKCANTLENSIKRVMPNANLTIVTTDMLPYGDQAPDTNWKLQNDWQVYEASPYDETIKLEADLFIPRNIEHWFDVMSIQDVVVCTKIRNFKQELSDCKVYRRFIDDNNLPDVYNAITYFKKSDLSKEFFNKVKEIYLHSDRESPNKVDNYEPPQKDYLDLDTSALSEDECLEKIKKFCGILDEEPLQF